MAVGLGSVENVAAQSFEPFDLEHHLGLHQRLLQPSMGSLLPQLFCELLAFENYDLAWIEQQSDWLLDLIPSGSSAVLPALPSV